MSEHSLDERKFDLDAEIKLREIRLKETQATKFKLTPFHATIGAAMIALVSGILGALITGWSSLEIEKLKVQGNIDHEKQKQETSEVLEQKRFETALILEAVRTKSREEALTNLKFFVKAGFINDPGNKILNLGDESLPSITQPAEAEGQVVKVPSDHQGMKNAILRAQETLPHFWEKLHSADPEHSGFLLKVKISDERESEHIWLEKISKEGDQVFGIVNSHPRIVRIIEKGDSHRFLESEISDWSYIKGDKIFGGYTMRVLVETLPAEHGDKLKSSLAYEPK